MSPWDSLLDRLDHLVDGREPLPHGLETELADLLAAAMLDGMADRELDPTDCARWLAALVRTEARVSSPDGVPDASLSMLRVIVTRWLHPPRLDGTTPTFGAGD